MYTFGRRKNEKETSKFDFLYNDDYTLDWRRVVSEGFKDRDGHDFKSLLLYYGSVTQSQTSSISNFDTSINKKEIFVTQ